jgi:hypothetical protein
MCSGYSGQPPHGLESSPRIWPAAPQSLRSWTLAPTPPPSLNTLLQIFLFYLLPSIPASCNHLIYCFMKCHPRLVPHSSLYNQPKTCGTGTSSTATSALQGQICPLAHWILSVEALGVPCVPQCVPGSGMALGTWQALGKPC